MNIWKSLQWMESYYFLDKRRAFLSNPKLTSHILLSCGTSRLIKEISNLYSVEQISCVWAYSSPGTIGRIVAIMSEGKQRALWVGVMKMFAEDIEKVNKGVDIEDVHCLNDGLWHIKIYQWASKQIQLGKLWIWCSINVFVCVWQHEDNTPVVMLDKVNGC